MVLELGLDTFGDISADEKGDPLPDAAVIRDVVEQGVLADEVGIDFFGIGEHHRDDFAVSSPEMVLAAIGARTRRIRLGSAVTVLSSDDPIRVHQRFSTLDAISNGRAEIVVGRGSFTESFPLFGHDLADYEVLFEEKLDILSAAARSADGVTWSGSVRPPLTGQVIHPRPETPLAIWVGVGGSPESVVRAAKHDHALMLAIIGGEPSRFRQFVDLYDRACAHFGRAPKPVAVHSPGFVARTDDEARETLWPAYRRMRERIGAERGWPPVTRDDFNREADGGSLYVGSPESVATRIAATAGLLGLSRFNMKYSAGPLSHRNAMECIRLYGERVAPLVREMTGPTAVHPATPTAANA